MALMALPAMLSSCIKDEALNAEADIVSVTVPGDILIREPVVTNNEVRLYVNGWDNLSAIAPTFTLTDGATIDPASGTTRDFTTPQQYTVTSQDQQWKKTYTVSFLSNDLATDYSFENVRYYEYKDEWDDDAPVQQMFQIFVEPTADGTEMQWGSGNVGFMIANRDVAPTDYPTSQADDGYEGKCAKLVTRSTGALGAMFGSPIAAGNLFIGEFDMSNALIDAAKATHFGQPFRKTPLGIDGYYKYKAGEKFTDKQNNEVAGKKDMYDIYAVMYEVTDDVPYLDGSNIKTSPNIVMMAQIDDRHETDTWTRFSAEFKPVEGRTIDPEKLAAGKYNLAIVMSSSQDGAAFNGAVGSTLYVDEMHLYYE